MAARVARSRGLKINKNKTTYTPKDDGHWTDWSSVFDDCAVAMGYQDEGYFIEAQISTPKDFRRRMRGL